MSDFLGYIYLDVNPEPWAVGPLTLGRRNGKMFPRMERNASVFAFKEAVRGELEGIRKAPEGEYDLKFYLWRRLETYVGESGRQAKAHVADATNMQKALEDALQGVVFENDRDVRRIQTEVVEQGTHVVPGIVIIIRDYQPEAMPFAQIELDRDRSIERSKSAGAGGDNSWPPSL